MSWEPAKHNSECEKSYLGGMGKASENCIECIAQTAANVTHKPDCKMAFGRKDQSCGRCLDLLAGEPVAKTFRTLGRYS